MDIYFSIIIKVNALLYDHLFFSCVGKKRTKRSRYKGDSLQPSPLYIPLLRFQSLRLNQGENVPIFALPAPIAFSALPAKRRGFAKGALFVYLMYQAIGQSKIYDCVVVLTSVIIITITAK